MQEHEPSFHVRYVVILEVLDFPQQLHSIDPLFIHFSFLCQFKIHEPPISGARTKFSRALDTRCTRRHNVHSV